MADTKVKVEDLKEMKEQKQTWGYHSYRLNRDFSTVKELQEAEAAYDKEQAEKEALTQVRKEDAKKVEDAFKDFLKVREEAAKSIKNAEENYYAARAEFIKKYGYYHATYSSNDGIVSVSDLANMFFGNLFDIFN